MGTLNPSRVRKQLLQRARRFSTLVCLWEQRVKIILWRHQWVLLLCVSHSSLCLIRKFLSVQNHTYNWIIDKSYQRFDMISKYKQDNNLIKIISRIKGSMTNQLLSACTPLVPLWGITTALNYQDLLEGSVIQRKYASLFTFSDEFETTSWLRMACPTGDKSCVSTLENTDLWVS